MRALEHVLSQDPPDSPSSVEQWWEGYRALPWSDSWELALVGGWSSACMGYAFASGYQGAARALFADPTELWALCATETAGNHPRAIETRLDAGRLYGEKSFVTLGMAATRLAVVCHEGTVAGRKRIRVALVEAGAVEMQAIPPLSVIPEIGHARCVLDGVEAAEVLDGDGYLRVLKPFRTIEDLHVQIAFCGLVLRHLEERSDRAEVVARVTALAALTREDPLDPSVHIALGGLLEWDIERLGTAIPNWERDRALLGVAAGAQARRLERAWDQMSL
ncbi:MAG TPA: acyl-CoA dehydrogenase [Myxococcota bacterium]|nr:acyl-CoA dehydrogenase [Myxococcota bacterium]